MVLVVEGKVVQVIRIGLRVRIRENGCGEIMLELNRIYNQDCVEGLKLIEDNSVDCIIIDPPYGINYQSNHRKEKMLKIENDDTLFIPLDDLWRILKPTGCMFIFYSHKKPLIDYRVKNVLVWVKNNWTAGDLEEDIRQECDFQKSKGDSGDN